MLSQYWPRLATGIVDLDKFQGHAIAWLMGLLIARHPDSFEKVQDIHEQMVRFYQSAPKDGLGRPARTHFVHEGKRFDSMTQIGRSSEMPRAKTFVCRL